MATLWTVDRTVAPADRPVTLEQVKLNLRLTSGASPLDSELLQAIDAATEQWEQDTDCPAIVSTFVQARFGFPAFGPIQLSKRPIQEVVSITYDDPDYAEQTLGSWALDKGRRQVYLTGGTTYPATATHNEAVKITYTAGYSSAATIPRYIQRAIMLQVGKWFDDPAMEFSESHSHDEAYERLVRKHLATFHAS